MKFLGLFAAWIGISGLLSAESPSPTALRLFVDGFGFVGSSDADPPQLMQHRKPS
jgi:hypothetical protein